MADLLIKANAGFFGAPRIRASSVLGKRFIIPPFSVMDARQGDWSARKRLWKRIGIRGEEGRIDPKGLVYSRALDGHGAGLRGKYKRKKLGQSMMADGLDGNLTYEKSHRAKRKRPATGRAYNIISGEYRDNAHEVNTGTSIFDPVLCECVYRWFCPAGGTVLDPFAGGSTRGVVAEVLGYGYTGIEIRENQIMANVEQAASIGVDPNWIWGDSGDMGPVLKDVGLGDHQFDLMFTCPPYYDLEVYSIDNRDGSTHATYDAFMVWYRDIFADACARLADNRFAVVVVGEIRGADGAYRGLVPDTVAVFRELGLHYYNEMVLITPAGSLPLRTKRQFDAARKIGKAHQNILVFYKGDLTKIKGEFGAVAV